MNIKFKVHMTLARFYNYFVNSRISLFFNLNIISLVISSLTKDFYLILFLEPLILLLTLTTYRLSDVGVYSSLLKCLSMNLKDVSMFNAYDYDNPEEKSIISGIFRDEFILFLQNAHKKNFNVIKMTTHKWVVENIILSNDIASIYESNIVECGKCKSTLEVLLLAGKYTPSAYIDRQRYKVILKRR